MKHIKCISLMLIVFLLIFGCSGNYGKLEPLSESESKAIRRELIDSWSDYDISFKGGVIVFDPKNDDKKILVGNYWGTVKDQETWIQIVNGTSNEDVYNLNMLWGEPIREIWVHNQFYGYIITLREGHYYADHVSVMVVDDNTVRPYTY